MKPVYVMTKKDDPRIRMFSTWSEVSIMLWILYTLFHKNAAYRNTIHHYTKLKQYTNTHDKTEVRDKITKTRSQHFVVILPQLHILCTTVVKQQYAEIAIHCLRASINLR